jgi:hypothetical protein
MATGCVNPDINLNTIAVPPSMENLAVEIGDLTINAGTRYAGMACDIYNTISPPYDAKGLVKRSRGCPFN